MIFTKIIGILIIITISYIIIKSQFYLSNLENRFYGLILPFLIIAISIVVSLGSTPTQVSISNENLVISESGEVVDNIKEEENNNLPSELIDKDTVLIAITYTFCKINIITIVLMIIYFVCRRKRKTRYELKKMALEEL